MLGMVYVDNVEVIVGDYDIGGCVVECCLDVGYFLYVC